MKITRDLLGNFHQKLTQNIEIQKNSRQTRNFPSFFQNFASRSTLFTKFPLKPHLSLRFEAIPTLFYLSCPPIALVTICTIAFASI